MNKVYYMDGYHGGIRGHMPLGAWRDILEKMKKYPQWRYSIDVEPISWDYVKERDPKAYEELAEWLKDNSENARVEIVGGTYGQPYGWITDGESNIRHLIKGRDVIREHFPNAEIDSYVSQEPCWTSALPQILRQLGFKRASLKNASTAWGGYSKGYPAEVVDWVGPDGTSIPTIPRYSCEELINVYATEARDAEPEFVEKCDREGIKHPTGMYYQDLGWPARPGMSYKTGDTPEYVEYSIARDYFNAIADVERPKWQPGQELICGALPWGSQVLVCMSRQVRRGEIEMLDTERLCAVASLYGMKIPEERLKEAEGHVLMTQHHDGWICASTGSGEKSWAGQAAAQIYAAEFIYDKVNREAFASVTGNWVTNAAADKETITVFNPIAKEGKRLVRVEMTAEIGTKGFEVYDGDIKIPCQAIEKRQYYDEAWGAGWKAGELLFLAELPALGIKTFTVRAIKEEIQDTALVQANVCDDDVTLENKYMSIRMNLKKGGVIESYYDKQRNLELVPEGAAFNELKGYFVEKERFCSNTEHPAKAKLEWDGALEAVVSIQGEIADATYTMKYTIQADSPKLDIQVEFMFPEKTYIGEPYDMIRGTGEHDPHRTYHDGRYRLNAYFPTVFEQKYIDKDCAYDVCRSKYADTHFKSFYEIKHNNLVHWADVSDGNQGLCIFCDHTTGYIHGGETSFGLALAWGYEGGYWWGLQSMQGSHELRYQIMAHDGEWQQAGLWHECERFLHQPSARRSAYAPEQNSSSIFRIQTEGVELGAFYYKDGGYYVRVFNASGQDEAVFRLNNDYFTKMEETGPDGTPFGRSIPSGEDSKDVFKDEIPPFGIRTYRLTK